MPSLLFNSVLALCASLSHFQVFLNRRLWENALTGTIPPQISALVNLEELWVLTSFLVSVGLSILAFDINECWHQCLLTHDFKFFFAIGTSTTMPWRAQSRLKYQRWPTWTNCMPQVWLNLLSVGHVFIECWPCAPLSHIFKRSVFFLGTWLATN